MTQSESIYILIPVHNRRSITLKCLSHLQQLGDLDRYCVVVIDDGSTDGTGQAIREQYPDVELLVGDGHLWWTGAIAKGMKYSISKGASYLIWLNDDCLPQPSTIAALVKVAQQDPHVIVGGRSLDPETLAPSYGGVILHKGKIQPAKADPNGLTECDGLNGNLVCLSKQVVQAIGYPNHQLFPQYHGDTSYTHTAKKQGYKLIVLETAIAHCQNDHIYLPSVDYWLKTDCLLWNLWHELFTIKSAHYWKAELGLYGEFFGLSGLWFYLRDRLFRFCFLTLIILTIPLNFRLRLMPFFARFKTAKSG